MRQYGNAGLGLPGLPRTDGRAIWPNSVYRRFAMWSMMVEESNFVIPMYSRTNGLQNLTPLYGYILLVSRYMLDFLFVV